MRKFIRSISIIMSFMMMFLLVDSSLVKAVIGSDTFGYQSISVNKQEDGTKQMYLFFDDNEIKNIKEVKVYVKLTTHSNLSDETKSYKTYSLTAKNEISFYTSLESSEMRDFGTYSLDKIEIIKNDDSKKVLYNSLWNSSLAGNNSEDGAFITNESIYSESCPVTFDSLTLDKTTVTVGEDQVVTFNSSISDEQVSIKEVYVILDKSIASETDRQVVKASLKSDGKYEARLSFKNSLQTGSWYVKGFEVIDSFERNANVQNFSPSTFKVASENADINPPKLLSYELVNGNVYDGLSEEPQMYLKIEASDDLSGIESINVAFFKVGNDQWNTYEYTASYINGEGYYKVDIPSSLKNGEYIVKRIHIGDKAKNNKLYFNKIYEDTEVYVPGSGEFIDLDSLNFTVKNNEQEGKFEILSIEKNFNNAVNGYDLEFTVDFKCNIKMERLSLDLIDENKKSIYINIDTNEIKDNGDGTYTAKIKGSEYKTKLKYIASGNYRVQRLNASNGNNFNTSIHDVRSNMSGYTSYDFSKVDFICTNPNEDLKEPTIKKLELDKNIVTPGEKVTLTLKLEDDVSGISSISYQYSFLNNYKSFEKVEGTEDTYKVELEIEKYISTGIYPLEHLIVTDNAGNSFYYFKNQFDSELNQVLSNSTILVKSDLNEKMPPTITSNIKDGSMFVNKVQPEIITDHGTLEMELDGKKYDGSEIKSVGTHTLYIKATGVDGSITTAKFTFKVVGEVNENTKVEEVIDQIVNSTESNIQISINTEEKVVNKEIFEAIKGTDKSVTFIQDDGTEWSFSGKDIKDGANINDIKLSVKSVAEDKDAAATIEEAAEDARVIHFDYHGELPGKATVKIFVGERDDLIGKDLTFYYYNAETKKIEKVQGPLVINNNGFVTVEITHCSDYFLSAKDNILTDGEDSDVTEPGDSDVTEPGDSDVTEPGDSDVTEPGDSDVTEPGDSDATEPGDDNVTVPDKETVKADDSAHRIEPGKGLEKNNHGNNEDTKTGDVGNNTKIVVFILGLSALVLLRSYKKKRSSIII